MGWRTSCWALVTRLIRDRKLSSRRGRPAYSVSCAATASGSRNMAMPSCMRDSVLRSALVRSPVRAAKASIALAISGRRWRTVGLALASSVRLSKISLLNAACSAGVASCRFFFTIRSAAAVMPSSSMSLALAARSVPTSAALLPNSLDRSIRSATAAASFSPARWETRLRATNACASGLVKSPPKLATRSLMASGVAGSLSSSSAKRAARC